MINISISLRTIKLAVAILIVTIVSGMAIPVLSRASGNVKPELKLRLDEPAIQPSFLKEFYVNPTETLSILEVEAIVLVPYNGENLVAAIVELMYIPDADYSSQRGYIFLRNNKMQNLFSMAYASNSQMEIVARQTELPEDWPYLRSIIPYEVISLSIYPRS